MTRMKAVHNAIHEFPPLSSLIDPLEIWEHDATGQRVSITVF